MKLVRYGNPGQEKPGLIDGKGVLRDLSAHVPDITPEVLAPERLAALARIAPETLPAVPGDPRLGPPLSGISKIIAVGLNYVAHAKESGMAIPSEPVLFTKHITSISGPNDPVVIPRGSKKTDWEVELAVVIGRTTRYVNESEALDHVAGYTICNDVSEREYQLERGGQWVKGKSCDTFCPLGPWLATKDEIPDPQALDLWLEVNGERVQNSNTSDMIFSVRKIVSYISHFITLSPGDVIPTGTPFGVGLGLKPQRFLKPGDTMRLGITGLGEQRQTCVAWEERR
ncbi:MAG: fumarylacetoacetate hydrolase family protein [Rhodospirillaceae bacterium]|nr:fumarylacetoacetate hydrolase family protein [Rhodospirillaceae bacterium]